MENITDLQQQRLIEKELVDAGLPQNKLNSLLTMLDEQIKCGPECQKLERENNLKRLYNNAVTNYIEGPSKIKTAEQKYYETTKGSAYYNDILKSRYTNEVKDKAIESINEHKNNINEIQSLLKDYDSEIIYSDKMKKLLNKLITENNILKENIDQNKSSIQTNDRKTFYEDQQIDNLYNWKRIIIALFWFLFTALCVNALFLKKKYSDYKVWIRLFFVALMPFYIIPFIQKIILKIYHLIVETKDILKIKNVYVDLHE